jgi:glycosyltransferase involved in cell wall biosynthesis
MRAPAVAAAGRRLRIVLPTGIFPPDIGGPASYVPRIAEALAARGHSVEVVTLADDPAAEDAFPFPVQRIRRRMRRIPRMIETIQSVRSLARAADVIYANGLFIEAAIAAALAGKPLVMKVVGDWAWERASNQRIGDRDMLDFQNRRQPFRFELVKGLRSCVTRRADRVIVASRFFSGIVAGWGVPPERMEIISNALEPLPDVPPAKLPAFEGRTLAIAARLIPFKRIDELIRMVAARGDLRLLIVGDGPERVRLEQLAAELKIAERAIFTGSVPRGKVAAYLRAADALVVNSANETFSFSVLEGFAAGIPVIASNAGSIPELIADGENGLLFPPGDVNMLSKAVVRLFSEPGLRERITRAGRKAFEDRFPWESLVDQTEAVLRKAAPGGGGSQ